MWRRKFARVRTRRHSSTGRNKRARQRLLTITGEPRSREGFASKVRPVRVTSSEVAIMATVLKPPAPLDVAGRRSVFLAGSIEMGLAEPWQAQIEQALGDLDVVNLNPRRDEW